MRKSSLKVFFNLFDLNLIEHFLMVELNFQSVAFRETLANIP